MRRAPYHYDPVDANVGKKLCPELAPMTLRPVSVHIDVENLDSDEA